MRPVLPGFYQVIPMDKDGLQLRAAGRVMRLSAPGQARRLAELLPALDGRHTVGELSRLHGVDPELLGRLMKRLREDGIVEDVSDLSETGQPGGISSASELAFAAGCRPSAVQRKLAATTVAIVGCGPVGRLVAHHLVAAAVGELVLHDPRPSSVTDDLAVPTPTAAEFGASRAARAAAECELIRGRLGNSTRTRAAASEDQPEAVVDAADLVVLEVAPPEDVATVVNRQCLSAARPLVAHQLTLPVGIVGPSLNGHCFWACLECLRARRATHRRHQVEQVVFERHLRRQPDHARKPVLASGFAAMIAGVATAEALRIAGGLEQPLTVGGLLMIDLRSSSVRREALLPVPGCPGCGHRQTELALTEAADPPPGAARAARSPGVPGAR